MHSLSRRLYSLEKSKGKFVYPCSLQAYKLDTPTKYRTWMLANNPKATAQDIDDLKIKSIQDMYR